MERDERKIDKLVRDVHLFSIANLTLISRTRIKTWKAVFIIAFFFGLAVSSIFIYKMRLDSESRADYVTLLMQKMKTRGCVADGLLTGSGGDTAGSIALINRSECQYLHRAVETWAAPPDFSEVSQNMARIQKEGLIYGMFLAEAVGTNSTYYYPDENRYFNFPAMCREGSAGFWGNGTCKAYFGSQEYRKYLRYITRKAIDLGIQSFMFGQIYFQDNDIRSKWLAKDIVKEMRSYADSKNKTIVIGAQTNDIDNKDYLNLFDYIEGGVGVNNAGNIENGPCLSRWWKRPGDRCWALLWNDRFAQKAKNVFLHLDWSGLAYDDMSVFARMDQTTRAKTLANLYRNFTQKNMGFMMPYLAVVYDRNNGCFGAQRNYYSPDNKYSCKDEDAMAAIFKGNGSVDFGKNNISNDAVFTDQSVPAEMVSGQEYTVSVTVENTGTEIWTPEKLYRLGSQNPEDSPVWRGRINLAPGEEIKPGDFKTFNFTVKAPEVGKYNFQWKMLEENVEWFGGLSENVEINVVAPPEIPATNP